MDSLIKLGPFLGLDATKEDYYLEQGMGNVVSNVDVSAYPGGFTSALGRNLFATLSGIPNGYTTQCLAQFTSFTGTNTLSTKRVYVFSAVSGSNSKQGWYDPSNQTTTFLPSGVTPFTQAVQFGAFLWVNSGFKLSFNLDGTLAWDQWQISVPSGFAYGINGTYAVTSGNAPVDTYSYAITLRRSNNWGNTGILPGGGSGGGLNPNLAYYQESSPVFSTSVTVATGQQPGFAIATGVSYPLANLITGTTIGGETYYGALYRSRNGNSTYQFVDYLQNLTQMNDHNGNPAIIDTYADSALGAYLQKHDPPPMMPMTFPGPTANNGSPSSVAQFTAQQSFTFTNPALITKHKNRMWAFTLYPTQPIQVSEFINGTTFQVAFDPQLWFSDANTPWSWNASQQVLRVGSEDTPGNCNIDNQSLPPWSLGTIEDTPMQLASAGSYLVLFKSQTVWTLLGDSPSEWMGGGLKRSFDIGCSASASVTTAEGGVFWLAPTGVYFFNGGSPTYIGEDVRGYIESLPWSQQQAAVGSYRDRTFYLSFPNSTLAYYTPSQKWYLLPYGASAAVFSPFNQNSLIFANGNQLQTVNVNPATDLGQSIVSTWQSNVSDCGTPGQLSSFRMFYLVAPKQQGIVTMQLDLDIGFTQPKTIKWTWDLSRGKGAYVHSLPTGTVGYNAQVTITTTTNTNATSPIIIRAAAVLGTKDSQDRGDTSLDDLSGALNGVLHG